MRPIVQTRVHMAELACYHCNCGLAFHPIYSDVSHAEVTIFQHPSGLSLHMRCVDPYFDSLPPEVDKDVFVGILNRMYEDRRFGARPTNGTWLKFWWRKD